MLALFGWLMLVLAPLSPMAAGLPAVAATAHTPTTPPPCHPMPDASAAPDQMLAHAPTQTTLHHCHCAAMSGAVLTFDFNAPRFTLAPATATRPWPAPSELPSLPANPPLRPPAA
ncbi:MAG TPA: hypothetical protein VFN09_09075 [Rhodanobacteraceae bacterium]|nr:hypothetical protein [Rhodanobacteraceae bacterium]